MTFRHTHIISYMASTCASVSDLWTPSSTTIPGPMLATAAPFTCAHTVCGAQYSIDTVALFRIACAQGWAAVSDLWNPSSIIIPGPMLRNRLSSHPRYALTQKSEFYVVLECSAQYSVDCGVQYSTLKLKGALAKVG